MKIKGLLKLAEKHVREVMGPRKKKMKKINKGEKKREGEEAQGKVGELGRP